jgi:CHASE2 domain-containing sensor protein
MIVMREPVPDKVAQAFLTHFLKAFARGDSLYLAERQARERLQGLEGNFPCASWLPAIYQNPAAIPPDWQTLKGRTPEPEAERRQMPLSRAFFASLAVTLVVMGVRSLGFLQPLELWGFDRLMGQRPPEAIDPRLLVVEVTEADVAEYNYPLEDATLARIITQLEQHEPRAIGIDMHRHQPRGEGRDALLDRFAQNQNLFLVCAYGSSDKNYAPPSEFTPTQIANQVGFSDLIVDSFSGKPTSIRGDLIVGEQAETESRIVRRQLLSYDPSLSPAPSTCTTPYSFSLQLAFQYLYQEGVEPLTVNDEQQWQFGDAVFPPLTSRFGGYQQLNGAIEQIAINYRSHQPGQKVTLQRVLEGNIEENLVKNRVILIGYTAPVARDNFNTPYGKMPGVWVHAHMVSQLLSAVEDERPLIWTLPQWGDALWVLAWSLVGGLLAWALKARSPVYLILATAIALFVLYQLCLFLLIQGGWMPLIPAAIALVMASGLVVIYPAIAPRKFLVSRLKLGTKSAGSTS